MIVFIVPFPPVHIVCSTSRPTSAAAHQPVEALPGVPCCHLPSAISHLARPWPRLEQAGAHPGPSPSSSPLLVGLLLFCVVEQAAAIPDTSLHSTWLTGHRSPPPPPPPLLLAAGCCRCSSSWTSTPPGAHPGYHSTAYDGQTDLPSDRTTNLPTERGAPTTLALGHTVVRATHDGNMAAHPPPIKTSQGPRHGPSASRTAQHALVPPLNTKSPASTSTSPSPSPALTPTPTTTTTTTAQPQPQPQHNPRGKPSPFCCPRSTNPSFHPSIGPLARRAAACEVHTYMCMRRMPRLSPFPSPSCTRSRTHRHTLWLPIPSVPLSHPQISFTVAACACSHVGFDRAYSATTQRSRQPQ